MEPIERPSGQVQMEPLAPSREDRPARILRWLGVILILETGLIHYLAAMTEFQEAEYMGYLFVANFLCGLLAAYGIYRRKLWGWLLGLGLAGASMAGYVWARIFGMPSMAVEEWFTPYGVVAMSMEGLFLLLLLFRPWRGLSPVPHFLICPPGPRLLLGGRCVTPGRQPGCWPWS